jgi:hypothetical protein
MGGVLGSLPQQAQEVLTGRSYFPELISAPFEHGLTIVFGVSAGLAFLAAIASVVRGGRKAPGSPASPERAVVAVGAGSDGE